jgi:hypothetical protein
MTTPAQQQEFEAAIQLHIQQAVAAALAGLPPPAAPAPPTVNVNAVAVKLPEFINFDNYKIMITKDGKKIAEGERKKI